MNEKFIILVVIVTCTIAVLGVYGLYRLIRVKRSLLLTFYGKVFQRRNASIEDWDRASLLCRIPGNMMAFLALEYAVLWLSIGIAGTEGPGFDAFFGLLPLVIEGLESGIGIVGVIGIFCTTIYGVYQDFPPHRWRALGAIGLFGIMVGLADRFH